jgi:hypothetical protein
LSRLTNVSGERDDSEFQDLGEKMTFQTKIKIGILFLFGLFACVFFVPRGEMQTQTLTAGQKFKNIKVLNDMPADQLGQVMNIMAASLGGDCKICHVSNDKDYEKDDNRNKNTARTMIKMTLAINKDNFRGQLQVSCNTCHNGRDQPLSVPSLATPVPGPERPKQPEVKPTMDQILSNYTAALHGKGIGGTVSTRLIKATNTSDDGKTIEPETIEQAPGKLRVKTTYGQTLVTETYDGANASKRAGDQDIKLRPDEVEQIKREAQLFGNADLKSVYSRLDYRFMDQIDGHEVYVVLATTAANQRERLYFDTKTGLLVRRVASTPTLIGQYQYQYDYLDYKDFGGVKLPTTVKFAMPEVRWTRKIVKVQNNANIQI